MPKRDRKPRAASKDSSSLSCSSIAAATFAVFCGTATTAWHLLSRSRRVSANGRTPQRALHLGQNVTFKVFDVEADELVTLPAGPQRVAEGELRYHAPANASAGFAILPALLQPSDVTSILEIVNSSDVTLERVPDSVDSMPSSEIYVYEDANEPPWLRASRAPLRKRLRALMDPLVEERITPFVRQRYPEACGRASTAGEHNGIGVVSGATAEDDSRACTPCWSLVKRYRPEERTSHLLHHDARARATVVVSLSDAGREHTGGLYLATSHRERVQLPLQRGDAVVHQSDLLHGVQVDEGERWSWVIWYRDSASCEDHSHEWFGGCAQAGHPLCAFLYASVAEKVPQLSGDEEVAAFQDQWLHAAAHGGVGHAMTMLGWKAAQMEDAPLAATWLRRAIVATDHPDAHYVFAQRLLDGSVAPRAAHAAADAAAAVTDPLAEHPAVAEAVEEALEHFEAAAALGHSFAQFNLGVAHLFGIGVRRSAEAASAYFEACGLPEGWQYLSRIWDGFGGSGRSDAAQAKHWAARARSRGFGQPWRKRSREQSGTGTLRGVSLHSSWARHAKPGQPLPATNW
jgi:hypothetical protein